MKYLFTFQFDSHNWWTAVSKHKHHAKKFHMKSIMVTVHIFYVTFYISWLQEINLVGILCKVVPFTNWAGFSVQIKACKQKLVL
jgi:hypothetical protein